jgi:hypothetical protein
MRGVTGSHEPSGPHGIRASKALFVALGIDLTIRRRRAVRRTAPSHVLTAQITKTNPFRKTSP